MSRKLGEKTRTADPLIRARAQADAQRRLEKSGRGAGLLVMLVSVVLGGIVWVVLRSELVEDEEGSPLQLVEEGLIPDSSAEFMAQSESLVRTFLAENDVEKRLEMVREPEEVRGHLDAYAKQALSGNEIRKVQKIGFKLMDGRKMMSFAVTFADGSMRLLNVIDDGDGPKVDWDSYARYGTASWQALLADGAPNEGEVRVFVLPGDYYNPPFDDRTRWTSLRLESPELDRPVYAFAEGDMAARMRALVMRSPNLRQHMVLRLKRHNGEFDHALFSVDELVAVGWVK